MKRVRVFFCSGCGDPFAESRFKACSFFQFLREHGVQVEACCWGGDLESIPTDTPVIVVASVMMKCSLRALAQRCAELGHLACRDDQLVLMSGSYPWHFLVDAANKFLEKIPDSPDPVLAL